MTASGVVLVGGPCDGHERFWDDGNDLMVIAAPTAMPALMMNHDPAMASIEMIPITQHAYMRDPVLPWRFIYQGERQQ